MFDLRIAHDVNTSDVDHCFHGFVKGYEALATNGHDYDEFTLDKQFIIGECTAKWGMSNFSFLVQLLLTFNLDSLGNLVSCVTSTGQ